MKQHRQHKKVIRREDRIYHLIAVPIFVVLALICAYPFYYLFIGSISTGRYVDLGQVVFLPKGLTLDNYVRVLKYKNIGNAAMISVLRVVSGTLLSLLVSTYAAYFFTKQKMWGRKFWYRMTVATMYFTAGMIPIYLNYRSLGLLNNFLVYIVPGAFNVYNMILIKTNIEALPPELEESAMIDGAGYFTRFFKIVIPLIKPILATTALFAAVAHWNDFFCTQMYITDSKLFTLQYLLYELLQQIRALLETPDTASQALSMSGIRMTMTMVTVVPIMCVYPLIQRHYVKGVMIGAVKG